MYIKAVFSWIPNLLCPLFPHISQFQLLILVVEQANSEGMHVSGQPGTFVASSITFCVRLVYIQCTRRSKRDTYSRVLVCVFAQFSFIRDFFSSLLNPRFSPLVPVLNNVCN